MWHLPKDMNGLTSFSKKLLLLAKYKKEIGNARTCQMHYKL